MAVKDKVQTLLGIAIKGEIFLHSFSCLLKVTDQHNVVVEAKTGPELFKGLARLRELPSVCIIDADIPGSYKAVTEIKKAWPGMHVIVLANAYTDYLASYMVLAGAAAILSKYSTVKELSAAIAQVQKKGIYYSKLVPQAVYTKAQKKELLIPVVTNRQLEMLQNCTTSANYAEIGVRMGITTRGVDTLKETLFKKFRVKNRTDLIMIALRAGLVSVD
jgi:two-component system, NarL family, invasion response regulator UvrY